MTACQKQPKDHYIVLDITYNDSHNVEWFVDLRSNVAFNSSNIVCKIFVNIVKKVRFCAKNVN